MLDAFARQVDRCREAAPFTAHVLDRSARWLRGDADALATFAAVAPEDPLAAAVPLRWAAALHHLALRGLDPWAARWPPHVDGTDDAALDAAIAAAWCGHRADIDRALAVPPQTNEVGRSAVLLPGLLRLARRWRLPLSLVEIGASAGLNLWCERYRYVAVGRDDSVVWRWGGAAAEVEVAAQWNGPPPLAGVEAAALRIARRAGCDEQPVDIVDEAEGLRLASYVWADERDRLARFLAARQAAARWVAAEGPPVQRRPAADFVEAQLRGRIDGTATVLLHSLTWRYLGPEEQARITAAVEAAGRRAGSRSPLAWLRMEPPDTDADSDAELRCRCWDGGGGHGEEQLWARCDAHGDPVEWLAADAGSDGAAAG